MNSIMIISKINMVTIENSYSQTQIVSCTKLKPKMLIKISVRIKKCLTLVIILLIKNMI